MTSLGWNEILCPKTENNTFCHNFESYYHSFSLKVDEKINYNATVVW